MNTTQTAYPVLKPRHHQRGQTLIIAMILLGVLLALGFVFLGLIDQNIQSAGRYTKRSVASDLADAGVRYVHAQMLTGSLGADWRGLPTTVGAVSGQPDYTQDPDSYYIRPGSGLAYRSDDPSQVDLGGPDGLGFYTRVNFDNGRALVRVRYAPSDANIFSTAPTGALRNPGRARNYIIIESIGRQGVINPTDPTTVSNGTPVQFQNYANSAALQTALGLMSTSEKNYPTSRKEIAFASIGIIESALYVTNKDHVSRAAEIGNPSEFGAMYSPNSSVAPQTVAVPQIFGSQQSLFNFGTPPTATASNIGIGGSIYINGDLVIHGAVDTYLNATLGDLLAVDGTITPADNLATLNVARNEYLQTRPGFPAGWYGSFPATQAVNTVQSFSGNAINSRQALTTNGGVIRDGLDQTDSNGFTRSAAYKAPPSMEQKDPVTGVLRYVTLTRESGSQALTGNSGRFGYGSGVYVDNLDDFQVPSNEVAASIVGSEESLTYDWLNPNNNQAQSGWQGPFYVPYGAFLQFDPQGWTIVRDAPNGNNAHAFWKAADGTTPTEGGISVNTGSIRYRVGMGTDGKVHVVNTFTPGLGNINAALATSDYSLGPVFNGVLYFEGNVRVRGQYPTDTQLTVVSGGTIYIEGSLTKGIVNNDVSGGTAGQTLTRPSRAALMLMARQYVTLNTTQFFGPGLTGGFESPNDATTPDGVFPVRVKNVGDTLTLRHEFLLNPNPVTPTTPATDPNNPSTWQPYDGNYAQQGVNGTENTELLISHAIDTGSAASTFVSLAINPVLANPTYAFALGGSNGASAQLGLTGNAPVYGLGMDSWQQFAQFETIGFQVVNSNFGYTANSGLLTGSNANSFGQYSIQEEATNTLTLGVTSLGASASGSYMLARAAIVPSDIRIEASIFAEEGSFFVIPGQWFNPNPNDSRLAYQAKIVEYENESLNAADATTAADQWRLDTFGSYPEAPFYGEPIDAKISILGSISENMTPPISQQAEWLKKWGWIPYTHGSSTTNIPLEHQGGLVVDPTSKQPLYAPNLFVTYDATLATGRVAGFASNNSTADAYIRTDDYGRPLPPMPRLPVSPTLAYFGDESF